MPKHQLIFARGHLLVSILSSLIENNFTFKILFLHEYTMCEKDILGTIYYTMKFDDLHMFLTFSDPALSSEGKTHSRRL